MRDAADRAATPPGGTDMASRELIDNRQRQEGRRLPETTKNIYGHLFAQDRTLILDAMNQAVSRLYA